MNLRKKLVITVLSLLFSLVLIPDFHRAEAAGVSVSSVNEMQPYLVTALKAYQPTYTVTFTGAAPLTTTQWKAVFNQIQNTDGNDYIGMNLKTYQVATTGNSGNYSITFTFTYRETAAQTAAVDAKIDDVLATLGTAGMNDYQKERAIHDWIVSNVSYDTTLSRYTAYEAITSPYKTVCQGYATLAYEMFTKAGLPARIIIGTGRGVSHAWNLVKIDGKWYQIDLTWDDPVTSNSSASGGAISYNYYNLTDAEMGVEHKWTGVYPIANTEFADDLTSKLTSDAANAATYQSLIDALGLQYLSPGNTCSSSTDIQYKLQQAVKANQSSVAFRYTNKSTLATDIRAAMSGTGYITSGSYTTADYTRTASASDVIVTLNFTSSIPVNATSVSLSQSTLSMTLGGGTTLIATVAPTNASNKTVVWTTSDAEVATVTKGVVRAVGGGTATITAETIDGGFSASCTVTVTAGVASIRLDKTTLNLSKGENATLTAAITPASASVKTVTWASNNPGVATVDTNGKVAAVASGRATITVTTADGGRTASCTVTVYDASSSISLSDTSLTLKVGKAITLRATVIPATAYNAIVWTSSDPTIATVSNGTVRPLAAGTATITAATTDGKSTASCTVTVVQAVTSIKFDKTELTIKVGGSDQTLTASVEPSNATTKTLDWKSSNTGVATVDTSGKVHAVAPGNAVVTATSTQDSSKMARCTITVYDNVSGVSLSSTALTLGLGKRTSLKATVTPATGNTKITWTSSNEAVVTVTDGNLRPIGVGTATITVTTEDGGKTATCTVTVIQAVSSIRLDKTTMSMVVNENQTLVPTVTPSTASDSSITWTSSDSLVATVDASGKVIAVAPGRTVITAASKQDSTKKANCTVSVYSAASGISLSAANLDVKMGRASTLVATVTPSTANREVVWTSSNEAVARVVNGLVRPVSTGTATITATTSDGKTATCTVKVIIGVTSVRLNQSSLTMKGINSTYKLSATITPSNASDQALNWTSSNTGVATVASDGTVTAVAPGRAVITAISAQDNTRLSKCTVVVYNQVTGITISAATLTVKMGRTALLNVAVSPSDSFKEVKWTSSNEAVAKVSTSGILRPVAQGTTVITATTTDGAKTASCTVTVQQGVTGIRMKKSAMTIKVGDPDQTLVAEISPTNASVQSVTWKSSNTTVAAVDANGVLHAVAAGTVVITVTSTDDPTKVSRCTVTVMAP